MIYKQFVSTANYRYLFLFLIINILTGCASTIKQQKEAELAVLSDSLNQTKTVLSDIKSGAIPPNYHIHVYLSNLAFNKALTGLDGFSFILPEDETIQITIDSIRISTYGALPTVILKAKAKKDDLIVDIDITALLVGADVDKPGAMKLKVLHFTPVAKWYFFEFTKSKFIRTLLAVELNKIADRLPTIQLPVSQAFTLGGPERNETVILPTGRDSTLKMAINFPSTRRDRKLEIVRYVFLESGIHVFGVLK